MELYAKMCEKAVDIEEYYMPDIEDLWKMTKYPFRQFFQLCVEKAKLHNFVHQPLEVSGLILVMEKLFYKKWDGEDWVSIIKK